MYSCETLIVTFRGTRWHNAQDLSTFLRPSFSFLSSFSFPLSFILFFVSCPDVRLMHYA